MPKEKAIPTKDDIQEIRENFLVDPQRSADVLFNFPTSYWDKHEIQPIKEVDDINALWALKQVMLGKDIDDSARWERMFLPRKAQGKRALYLQARAFLERIWKNENEAQGQFRGRPALELIEEMINLDCDNLPYEYKEDDNEFDAQLYCREYIPNPDAPKEEDFPAPKQKTPSPKQKTPSPKQKTPSPKQKTPPVEYKYPEGTAFRRGEENKLKREARKKAEQDIAGLEAKLEEEQRKYVAKSEKSGRYTSYTPVRKAEEKLKKLREVVEARKKEPVPVSLDQAPTLKQRKLKARVQEIKQQEPIVDKAPTLKQRRFVDKVKKIKGEIRPVQIEPPDVSPRKIVRKPVAPRPIQLEEPDEPLRVEKQGLVTMGQKTLVQHFADYVKSGKKLTQKAIFEEFKQMKLTSPMKNELKRILKVYKKEQPKLIRPAKARQPKQPNECRGKPKEECLQSETCIYVDGQKRKYCRKKRKPKTETPEPIRQVNPEEFKEDVESDEEPEQPRKKYTQEEALAKISKFVRGSKWFLHAVCSNAGDCLALGKYAVEMTKFFDFKSFKYLVNEKLVSRGGNGEIILKEYERDGFKAEAVLKRPFQKDDDNLMYEYQVGKFLNQSNLMFPCFLETYGLYLENQKQLKPVYEIDYKIACESSDKLSILSQYIRGSSLFFLLRRDPDFVKNELSNMLFIIYHALSKLGGSFTHYDFHDRNVIIIKFNKPIRYEYPEDGIVFYSMYMPKIIDYGRVFFYDGKTSTAEIHQKICETQECKPKCGVKVGFREMHTTSNQSQDLRLLNDTAGFGDELFQLNPRLYDLTKAVVFGKGVPARDRPFYTQEDFHERVWFKKLTTYLGKTFPVPKKIYTTTQAYEELKNLINTSQVTDDILGTLTITGDVPMVYKQVKSGGALTGEETKEFISASYEKKKDAQSVGDYKLDKSLSSKKNKVYVDSKGEVVIANAGTSSASDWANNAHIGTDYKKTKRYKQVEKTQKKAIAKYGLDNITNVAHSQSGHAVNILAKKGLTKEAIAVNPSLLGTRANKNVDVVRSSGDLVSAFAKGKRKTIKATSFNPITEHSANILRPNAVYGKSYLDR